jgi:hypothetical protein
MTLLLIAPKLQARDCFFLVESKLIVCRHKTTRSRIGICQQNLVAASLAYLSHVESKLIVCRHKTTGSSIGICQQNLVAATLADLSQEAAPVVKGKQSLLT